MSGHSATKGTSWRYEKAFSLDPSRCCINRTRIAVLAAWRLHRTGDMADQHLQPIKVVGTTGSPQCYAVRDFLYRNDVPFDWVELRTDEEARADGLESTTDRRLP